MLVLVGFFVGPIPLIGGAVHFALGIASAIVATGLGSERLWAIPAGTVLAATIAVPSFAITAAATWKGEWPAVIASAIPSLLFSAVAIELFRVQRQGRRS